MPCSPLIEPSSATTPSNSTPLGLVRAAHLVVVAGRDHDVDVDVAVAGVAEATECAGGSRASGGVTRSNSCGMRPFGTTTSWLNLIGVIVLSENDSSRRTRHNSSRSASSRARRISVAPASRQACSQRAPFLGDRLGNAVHVEQQQRAGAGRRERSPFQVGRDGFERVAVDQLERGRHDARLDHVADRPRGRLDRRGTSRAASPAPAASG